MASREEALAHRVGEDDLGAALGPSLARLIPRAAEDLETRLYGLFTSKSAVLPLEQAAELLGTASGALEPAVRALVERRRVMVQEGRDGRKILVKLHGAA